jgi:hypothetical protein
LYRASGGYRKKFAELEKISEYVQQDSDHELRYGTYSRRLNSRIKSRKEGTVGSVQCEGGKKYRVSSEELYTFKMIQKTYAAYLELHTYTSR